ncbi:hypothetical protein [Streptomyces sp. I5]|uniref:hypothetical protein n=1 Tax=Streptomyces sp. I5 TaxID=2759947 RepID=UPI0018EECA94|nr:hypothetical protein [Streptomyces sp. I5]MBJ6633373.1 hypothetical protein [Streptomyces sp. I5]
MPNLPPPLWAELSYSGAWNDITEDVRATTSQVSVTRGLSSESSSEAEPTTCTCDLDSRDNRYAPRNPTSPLYGLIGRNTPFRMGYSVGSPWAQITGGTAALITADRASLAVTDLDLRIDVALEDWGAQVQLASQFNSPTRAWSLLVAGTGHLNFIWSPDGTLASRIDQFSTEPIAAYNGQRMAVRVTLDVNNGAGGYELRFYTGRTVDDEEWQLLGEPIVGGAPTAIANGTGSLTLGWSPVWGSPGMTGKLFAFKLLNGIGGSTAISMKTSDATPGATSFSSGGATWSRDGGGLVLTNRHVRMAGEVPAWPPTRDLSGNDNYVSITPSGLLRRMDAGNRPQDSTLLRFIKAHEPIECWPLTDGPQSTYGRSLLGGQPMLQRINAALGDTPGEWQQGRLADWIEPVFSVKANTTGELIGTFPRRSSADAEWSVDLFLSGGGTPSAGTWTIADGGSGTDTNPQHRINIIFVGTMNQLSIIRETFTADSSSSALMTNIPTAGIFDEQPHHIRLTIDPGSTNTLWYVYVDGALRANGTLPLVMRHARAMNLGWGYSTVQGTTMSDRSFGFITYWDANAPSALSIHNAYLGWQGERAGARIERLAAEGGYTASVAGEAEHQQRMGIQGRKRLLELLNEASQTNFGYLLDARDRSEVIHRGHSTLWNQPPGLTLDFAAGLLSPPFRPVDDDKLTENDVSVRREYGSYPATAVLEEGPLSVQPPEAGGVGRYDTAYTYSLYTDDQAEHIAGMRLHLGTYAGVRYTRLTLNLANDRVFALIDDILRLDVGDKIRLTNLPPDHGPDAVEVLIAGYTEDAGPNGWSVTFNCVPAEPWTAAVLDSPKYGRLDTGGCHLTSAVSASATSVPVTTTGETPWADSANWPGEFPFEVRTGGEVMRVTACSGTGMSQTFTVVRGINGVTKPHSAGQDIRLANPVYIAL